VLKRHPNALKRARYRVSFRQNEAVFPRKWLAGDGLGLIHGHEFSNPSPGQRLRPISSLSARLIVTNTLPVLELRPTPK
jgi:hypothetical protein